MTSYRSVFRQALKDDFDRLHPALRERLGFNSGDGVAARGRGIMHRVRTGAFYMKPFLSLGARRRIMFPDRGENVPFTIDNYAWVDRYGRETFAWIRQFELKTPRRFDETMIYSEGRGCIVCYCGTHQHLAVDLFAPTLVDGSVRFRSGRQRLYEWPVAIPFPIFFSGVGDIRLSYDETSRQFLVDVQVRNQLCGTIIRYDGWFNGECVACTPSQIPGDVKPLREERRE